MNKKKVIINKLKKQKNFYLNLRYLYLKQLSNWNNKIFNFIKLK
ncbi:hypothetical protein TGPRC2_302009 (apicoplast) [Toxoplasma gondii TgCatPRC2]|uniref:ORF B n=10 Tax=Toxoplasma gondii TaxID=5811 RepID=Q9TJN5_TOXGO|nr:ORF B [Toxoplasma gondii RH]AAD41146.1 ORF B [Toxoplasma gondii]EPR56693.1 hypothetical protein TGGT1_302009 [Toxoplasma gondii GT1]EPT24415.1 ORF B [Toxoplasma gondii ME49]KFG27512.1 hypothetical protein TGP89_302009 [Toxoplasma gondii p89]KFG99159.1 hypothetical protein TGMAS_302009 [Toxoplasma gondii MAS]KYF38379.1 hypothetical protein TGARI_302009 [Toxoplasma gondii ARI]KYK53911.1 hypothetical protein TGPRC2_302009 [Toxoplasma gondii TgCatPRC2]PIL95806.1 ORF B [Toxoplasma gondii COUG|eukprot:NP_044560.1 ORF B (apicoplast) [Toxoplasma gondii RH]